MSKIKELLKQLKNEIPTTELKIGKVGTVKIRGLTAGERDLWEQCMFNSRVDKQAMKNIRASLVCRCLIEEDGSRVYGDSQNDLEEISALPAGVVDKIYEAAQKMSGLGEAVDELEKN